MSAGGDSQHFDSLTRLGDKHVSRERELESVNRRLSSSPTISQDCRKLGDDEVQKYLRRCSSLQYEVNLLRGVVALESVSDEHVAIADMLAQVEHFKAQSELARNEREKAVYLLNELVVTNKEATDEVARLKQDLLEAQMLAASQRSDCASARSELEVLRGRFVLIAADNERALGEESKLLTSLEESRRELFGLRDLYRSELCRVSELTHELATLRRRWEGGDIAFRQNLRQLDEVRQQCVDLEESALGFNSIRDENLSLRRENTSLQLLLKDLQIQNKVACDEKRDFVRSLYSTLSIEVFLSNETSQRGVLLLEEKQARYSIAQELSSIAIRGLAMELRRCQESLSVHEISEGALNARCEVLQQHLFDQNMRIQGLEEDLSGVHNALTLVNTIQDGSLVVDGQYNASHSTGRQVSRKISSLLGLKIAATVL